MNESRKRYSSRSINFVRAECLTEMNGRLHTISCNICRLASILDNTCKLRLIVTHADFI